MDDIFESAHGLEEAHYQEGYAEGVEAGRRAGRTDGRALGIQKGFEIGHEIGYYAGSVQIWRQLEAKSPGFIGARAEKAIAALEDLLRDFPLNSPRDERLQELMDAIRGRFKAAAAMLGLPESASAQEGTSGLKDPSVLPSADALEF